MSIARAWKFRGLQEQMGINKEANVERDNVVFLGRWFGNPKLVEINRKLISLDNFIRSRIIPPPIGYSNFHFAGGEVAIAKHQTTIRCDECEVIVRGEKVDVRGCPEAAYAMYCSIHCEIEMLRAAASS